MKKIVAIGCGGAGMFSGIVASQLKKGKFQAIALSDEDDIYCRCTTPYIFTNEAELADAIQPDSMAGDYGVKVVHEKAIEINTRKKQVITKQGNIFDYDYLVIATGAQPVVPTIEGIDGKNIYTLRTSRDAKGVFDCLNNAKSAVVIGAGVIGIETAAALAEYGLKVELIEREEGITKHIADEEFATKIVKHLKEIGVGMLFGAELQSITDDEIGIKKIIIKKQTQIKEIKADLVIIAAGIKPNVEILNGSGIEYSSKGVVVDNKMRTNIKNVYACGDCCVPQSAVTGNPQPSPLASSAIQQSKIVGFQIAGYPIKYNGSTGAFAFQFAGKEYAAVGLTESEARKCFRWVVTGKAETTSVYKDLKCCEELEVKLIFAGPSMRLVGYEAFGKGVIASAETASFIIGLRLNILKLLKFNYIAHPSLTPWPFMNPLIMASEDALNKVMQTLRKFLPFI